MEVPPPLPKIPGLKDYFGELMAQPLETIVGGVGPLGPCWVKSEMDDLWTFRLFLAAYRIEKTPVRRQQIVFEKWSDDAELKELWDSLAPYQVIELRGRALEKETGRHGLLETIIGSSKDAELLRIADDLQKPVTFETPDFELFTLDRRVNCFQSQTKWNGEFVKLTLNAATKEEAEPLLQVCGALWKSQPDWDRRNKNFAVSRLLGLKNDSWLGEDEIEVTAEKFDKRMTIDTIAIEPAGKFEFWYRDGGLF